MIIFFLWVIWIWILIVILTDVFRRHDTSGWAKAAWVFFIIVLPVVGARDYLIRNCHGMSERNVKEAQQAQSQMADYVRTVAGSGGAAGEIEKAKQLLDSGAIDQQEYDALKQKALATS